jgi:hypothetical protein
MFQEGQLFTGLGTFCSDVIVPVRLQLINNCYIRFVHVQCLKPHENHTPQRMGALELRSEFVHNPRLYPLLNQ